jgi:esterase/lipase superfamily enzyme
VLAVSALLTGQHARLGHVDDVGELADLDVTLVDVSAFSTGMGHFTLGDSPSLIAITGAIGDINAAFGRDPAARPGLLPGTVMTVRQATQIVLSPLDRLSQTPQ